MKLLRKILMTGIALLFVFCMTAGFSCCKSEEVENKKYDVTIKIASDDGEEWIFTPDIKELQTTREYDGKEHRYFVKEYQLVGHPRWGDKWFAPASGGANVFSADFLYTDLDGNQSVLRTLKDKGEYNFHCSARATSDLWNFRSVDLDITVI